MRFSFLPFGSEQHNKRRIQGERSVVHNLIRLCGRYEGSRWAFHHDEGRELAEKALTRQQGPTSCCFSIKKAGESRRGFRYPPGFSPLNLRPYRGVDNEML